MLQNLQKIWLIACLTLIVTVPVHAQSEAETVIMGYQLGMHLDSIPKQNLLKMGKFQKLYRYDRQDEKLSLDGMRLVYLRLFIWDSHLHSIEIKVEGSDGDNYKAFLIAVYGEGKKRDAMGYSYQWFLPTSRVLWDQNLATKDRQFVYESGSLDTLRKMVELNFGYTLLPQLALSDIPPERWDYIRYFKDPQPARQVSLVVHHSFLKVKILETLQKEILDNLPKNIHQNPKQKKIISWK